MMTTVTWGAKRKRPASPAWCHVAPDVWSDHVPLVRTDIWRRAGHSHLFHVSSEEGRRLITEPAKQMGWRVAWGTTAVIGVVAACIGGAGALASLIANSFCTYGSGRPGQ